MQRKLVWAASARRDLAGILHFVGERNVSAATRLNALIADAAGRIPMVPEAFRPGRVPDTREVIVHPNYILVYEVHPDRVRILRVMHARQRYP